MDASVRGLQRPHSGTPRPPGGVHTIRPSAPSLQQSLRTAVSRCITASGTGWEVGTEEIEGCLLYNSLRLPVSTCGGAINLSAEEGRQMSAEFIFLVFVATLTLGAGAVFWTLQHPAGGREPR